MQPGVVVGWLTMLLVGCSNFYSESDRLSVFDAITLHPSSGAETVGVDPVKGRTYFNTSSVRFIEEEGWGVGGWGVGE
jgi:hypothetical protein